MFTFCAYYGRSTFAHIIHFRPLPVLTVSSLATSRSVFLKKVVSYLQRVRQSILTLLQWSSFYLHIREQQVLPGLGPGSPFSRHCHTRPFLPPTCCRKLQTEGTANFGHCANLVSRPSLLDKAITVPDRMNTIFQYVPAVDYSGHQCSEEITKSS